MAENKLFRLMPEKKRFSVTIPHKTYELLKSWAEAEGSDAASQAAFIVQVAVAEAEAEGKIPSVEGVKADSIKRVLDYLFGVGDCREPDNLDIFNFAEAYGYEVGDVAKLIEAKKESCCESTAS